jgi:hypothetical protein
MKLIFIFIFAVLGLACSAPVDESEPLDGQDEPVAPAGGAPGAPGVGGGSEVPVEPVEPATGGSGGSGGGTSTGGTGGGQSTGGAPGTNCGPDEFPTQLVLPTTATSPTYGDRFTFRWVVDEPFENEDGEWIWDLGLYTEQMLRGDECVLEATPAFPGGAAWGVVLRPGTWDVDPAARENTISTGILPVDAEACAPYSEAWYRWEDAVEVGDLLEAEIYGVCP